MAWVRIAAFIVAVEYVAAMLVGYAVGFHYPLRLATFLLAAIGVSIFALGGYALLRVALYLVTNEPNPSRRIIADISSKANVLVGIIIVAAQMAVLGWLKVTLPYAVGFWADPLLADLDRALVGTDPWRITHALFGWASAAIDSSYITWTPLHLAMLLGLLFLPSSSRRDRCILAYFLIIGLSIATQYLLPSAGPVFYQQLGHGDRFADLPVQPWVQTGAAYLWDDYINPGGRVGSGISAMPSVHVGIAVWMALVVRAYLPRFQLIGWAWAALIFVGSIHLGWHYAVDGVVSVGIVAFAWMIAKSVPRQSVIAHMPEPRPVSID